MANLKIRYLTVALLLLATAGIVYALQYDSQQDIVSEYFELQKIPIQVEKWEGEDLPLDKSVYEILETKSIIHRNYRNGRGHNILLSIVYYRDTKVDFHAPEACLGGRGRRTEKTSKMLELDIGSKVFPLEVAEIVAKNPTYQGVSYYFYKAGAFLGQNYMKMRLNLAKNKFTTNNKSGALVRFSAGYSNEENKVEMEREMKYLMEVLMPHILSIR